MDDAKALIAASPLKILACDDLDEAAKMVRSKPPHHKEETFLSLLSVFVLLVTPDLMCLPTHLSVPLIIFPPSPVGRKAFRNRFVGQRGSSGRKIPAAHLKKPYMEELQTYKTP